MSVEDKGIFSRFKWIVESGLEKVPWVWTLIKWAKSFIEWFKEWNDEWVISWIKEWFKNVWEDIDKATWWYISNISKMYDKDFSQEITKEEDDVINEIKNIRQDYSADPRKIISSMFDWLKSSTWLWESLVEKLNKQAQWIELPESINNEVLWLEKKIKDKAQYNLNKAIQKEIDDWLLPKTDIAIEARTLELQDKYFSESLESFKNEISDIENKTTSLYLETEWKIYSDYIKEMWIELPEWMDAKDYVQNYGSEFLKTRSYIQEKLVQPEMEKMFWTEYFKTLTDKSVNTAESKALYNMIDKMQEVLARDLTYKYETLSIFEDPKDRAKAKAFIDPQIEARKKYNSLIINDFQKQLSEYKWNFSDLTKSNYILDDVTDKMIKQAYSNAFKDLSEEEKKALILRDGTDTAVQMLVNNAQRRQAFEWVSLKDWISKKDFKDWLVWVWNVIENWIDTLWAAVWWAASWVASETFKDTDEKKIYYDEYELALSNENWAKRLIKHVLYNIDDIAEVVIPVWIWQKINIADKALNKSIAWLRSAQTLMAKNNWHPVFKYTWNWIATIIKAWAYWARWVTSWVVANELIDKNMRQAESEANTYLNMMADAFIEPVLRVWWKIIWTDWWVDTSWLTPWWASVSTNKLAQAVLDSISGNKDTNKLIDDLVLEMKDIDSNFTREKAVHTVWQWRDFVLWLNNVDVNKIFTKQDSMLLYKTIADNLSKLEETKKAWADKIFTKEWAVLQLDDLTTYKSNALNEVTRSFDLLESWNQLDKKLWEVKLEEMYNSIPDIISGKLRYEWAFLKIPQDKQVEIKTKFESRINAIKNEKDIEIKKANTSKLMSDLFDIRNMYVSDRDKLTPQITLYAPLLWKEIKVDFANLKELWNLTYEDLVKNRIIKIWETESKKTNIPKWEYVTKSKKDSYFNQKKSDPKDTTKYLLPLLSKWKWEWIWFQISIDKDQLDEYLDFYKWLFWNDINIFEIESSKWRKDIVSKLKAEDNYFSLWYWEYKWKTILYLGLGKKIIDSWFTLSDDVLWYHKQVKDLFLDITSEPTLEEWIRFALPIHNISNLKEYTAKDKTLFLQQILLNKWLATKKDWVVKVSPKWTEIATYIKQQTSELWNTFLDRYIYETSVTRIVDNYDVLKSLLDDISNYNQAIANWDDVMEWVINSIERLNLLINSFKWAKTISRWSDESMIYFNTKDVRKEAKSRFKQIKEQQRVTRIKLEEEIQRLTNDLYVWEAKVFNDLKIQKLRNQIENNEKIFNIDEKQFVKEFIDNTFTQSFNNLFTKQLNGLFKIIETIEPTKIKNSVDLKNIVDQEARLVWEVVNIRREINAWNLSESKTNELKRELKEKEVLLNKLILQKDKIDTPNVQLLDITRDRQSIEILKELEQVFWIWGKEKHKLQKILETINKHKQYINDNENLKDAVFNLIQNNWVKFSKDQVRFVTEAEIKKALYRWNKWEIDLELEKKESALLKMFSTALTWAENSEMWRGKIILNTILAEYWIWSWGKTIEDIYSMSDWLRLSDDKKLYIDEAWNEFKRVTDVIWANNIKVDWEDRKKLLQTAKDIWNENDRIVKDVLLWKEVENTITEDSVFLDYISKLKTFKDELINSWEEIVWTWIKVSDINTKIAWEIDLLTKNIDWTYNIYEFQTRRTTWKPDRDVTWDIAAIEKVWKQLNEYAKILELNWLRVKSTNSVFTKVSYESEIPFANTMELWLINRTELETKAEVNTLQDLYFSDYIDSKWKTFKENVEWFLVDSKNTTWWDYVETKNIIENANAKFKEFESYINNILEKSLDRLELKANKWDKVFTWKDVLIELNKNHPDFISKIYKKVKQLTTQRKWFQYNKDTRKVEETIVNDVILTKELEQFFESKWESFKTIQISNVSDLWNIIWDKDFNIRKIVDDFAYPYSVWSDYLKFIMDIVNWTNNYKEWDKALIDTIDIPEDVIWQIKQKLKLKKSDYIMWTYWDKDTILVYNNQEWLKFNEVEDKFTKLLSEWGWFLNKNWEDLSVDSIAKRITAMVSEKKEFEKVNMPIKTYIIEPIEHINTTPDRARIYNSILEEANKQSNDTFNITEYYEDLYKLDPDIKWNEELFSKLNKAEFLNKLKLTYANDMEDWFSAMTNDLAELHDLISTWKTHIRWHKKDKAKKFHFVHEHILWDWRISKMLWKTLFNRANVLEFNKDWIKVPVNKAVFIWESSLKLKWNYTKYTKEEERTIFINWIQHKIIWEVEWTTTQAFRSAASDSYKVKDEQTISEQIVNLMHYTNKKDYLNLMTQRIDTLWWETIWTIWEINKLELTTFSDLNKFINDISSKYELWSYSDTLIKSKAKKFLDWVTDIIWWAEIQWQSHEITRAMIDLPNWQTLKRNEVIVSKNSTLYINTIKELKLEENRLKEIKEPTIEETSKLSFIQDQLQNWIYVTAFRNPIPNIENLWLYRVRLAEDLKIELWSHDSILHPEAIFEKLQADFDGDHIIFLPTTTKEWEIIAKEALWLQSADSLYDRLSENIWWKIYSKNFINRVAAIAQVDTDPPKAEMTLLQHFLKNLEAKKTVWVWSATIRSFNILRQMMDEYRDTWNEEILKEYVWKTWYGKKEVTYTLWDLLNKIKELEWNEELDINNLFNFDSTYWGKAWSVLQLILDFAKDTTWLPFDRKKWIKDLLETTNIKSWNATRFLFQEILSPLWMSHKSATKDLKVWNIYEYIDSGKYKNSIKKINSTMWMRRDLFKYLYNKKYFNIISDLKESTEVQYTLSKIIDDPEIIWKDLNLSNESINALQDFKSKYNEWKDLLRWVRDEIKSQPNNIVKRFLEEIENTKWEVDYNIIYDKLHLINNKWELNISKSQRDLIALLSLNNGNKQFFNILTDIERIWQLFNSQWNRLLWKKTKTWFINSLLEINPDFVYTALINKPKELIDDWYEKLLSDIKEIELSIVDLQNKLNNEWYIDQDVTDSMYKQIEAEEADMANYFSNFTTNKQDELLTELSQSKETLIRLNDLKDDFILAKKALVKNAKVKQDAKELLDEFAKTTDVKFDTDYLNTLDITYRLWDNEQVQLKANIDKAINFNDLLNKWTRLTLEQELSYYDRDSVANLYIAKEIWAKNNQVVVFRNWITELANKYEKILKKAWLNKNEVVTFVDVLKSKFSISVDKSNEKWYKNVLFIEDKFDKSIDKDLETRLLDWNITQEQLVILKEFANDFKSVWIQPLVSMLSELNLYFKERWWYTISSEYWPTFYNDLEWLFSWDMQFEFRRKWIYKWTTTLDEEKAFLSYLEDRAKYNWVEPKNWKYINTYKAKVIHNAIYWRQTHTWVKFIKHLQWLHYFGSYQLGSVILGWAWHIWWMTQILGNTLEILWWNTLFWHMNKDADKMLEHFGLRWENLLAQWQSLDAYNTEDTMFQKLSKTTSSIIKKIAQKVWITDIETLNLIDTTLTDSMFATDLLQNVQRKRASMLLVMREMWFSNMDQMLKSIKTKRDFETVKILFYKRHAELWGSVISTIPLLRKTFITEYAADSYYATKIFKTLYWYLMWWSIGKVINSADRTFWLVKWINLLKQWKINEWRVLIQEWVDMITATSINLITAIWIWIKIDKYDFSWEDKNTNLEKFVKDSTNMWIAFEIMFSREIENIKMLEWESHATNAATTLLWFFEHLTRVFKTNQVKIWIDMYNRITNLWESPIEAFYNANKNLFSTYVRWSYWLDIQSAFWSMAQTDNLWLYYWTKPEQLQQLFDLYKTQKIAKAATIWVDWLLLDYLVSFIQPSLTLDPAINKAKTAIMNDENVRKLYEWWVQEYNLDLLFTKWWFTDNDYIEQAWKELIVYQSVWDKFDDNMFKDLTGTSEQRNKYDDMITKRLQEMWYTINDLYNWPVTRNSWMQKLYYEISQWNIPELSTKHLLSYIANNKYYELESEQKKLKWKWSKLEEFEKNILKRKILKEMASNWLLDLNMENSNIILWLHWNKYHEETINMLRSNKALNQFNNYMNWLMISNWAIKEWDTSARYLTTEFWKALSWYWQFYSWWTLVKPTSESVDILLAWAKWILANIAMSNEDAKTKVAKQAALLNSLNDTAWDLFKNDKVFSMLSSPAQKQLISWIYKTNKELNDYDADSIANYQNNSIFTSSKKGKYTPNYFRKNASSNYWSWPRPWFAQQFPRMWEFLQWKQVPQNYERIANSFIAPTWARQFVPNAYNKTIESMWNYAYKELTKQIFSWVPQSKIAWVNYKPQQTNEWYIKVKRKWVTQPYKKVRVKASPYKQRRWTIWFLPWATDNIS